MPLKSKISDIRKKYSKKKNSEENITSATNAIGQILNMKNILDKHKKELLSVMIWKISEANGKWNLNYLSEETLSEEDVSIYHEHVVTRQELIKLLLAQPDQYKKILSKVTACLVTKSEHNLLEKHKHLSGWDRYKKAGIKVFDRKEKVWIL